jgi:hypothetical protein
MAKVLRFGVSRALLLAPMSAALLMGCGDDQYVGSRCAGPGGPVYDGCPIVNPASAFEQPDMSQMRDEGSLDGVDMIVDHSVLDDDMDQDGADQDHADDGAEDM